MQFLNQQNKMSKNSKQYIVINDIIHNVDSTIMIPFGSVVTYHKDSKDPLSVFVKYMNRSRRVSRKHLIPYSVIDAKKYNSDLKDKYNLTF